MRYSLKLIDPPAAAPITLAEAKQHLRVISLPPSYDNWVADNNYTLGERVYVPAYTDMVFEVTTAGTSDSSEPTWDATVGNTTTDNTVEWTAVAWEDEEDNYIENLIEVATAEFEEMTQRALLTQQWQLKLSKFQYCINLPRPPLQTTDFALQYTDSDGVTHTIDSDDYVIDTDSMPGRIYPAYNKTWLEVTESATLHHVMPVTITFKAGHGDAADVPELYKSAIKLILANFYENREEQIIDRGVGKVVNDTLMRIVHRHRVEWSP